MIRVIRSRPTLEISLTGEGYYKLRKLLDYFGCNNRILASQIHLIAERSKVIIDNDTGSLINDTEIFVYNREI